MDLWHSIGGMVEAEMTDAEPERTLTVISGENIELRNLRKHGELTYTFCIRRKECRHLEQICGKRGSTLNFRKRMGLYWQIQRVLNRPIVLIGGVLLLTLVLWLPTRVLFICVDGNSRIPERKILAAAEECGITFGASRRMVRSEKVKNALLSAIPQLQWAGVNTSGCIATISVREKAESEEEEIKSEVASIEASRDGYILFCTVTRGNQQVKPGDSVTEGQTLISAYTDCGLCIRAERAEGEIFAQTNREFEAVMLSEYVSKGQPTEVKRKISLRLGKKRIFLWKDSGIWDASCGRMYEEYYVTLPGGFQLPFALCVEKYTYFDTWKTEVTKTDAEADLEIFAQTYLTQQMAAGSILRSTRSVALENGVYRLRGEYICAEMIGRIRQEQIGDRNGKNS